ncbi:HigA family addiction module antitoxin [Rheinheimera baltica]|uniref:HigA family addiction module antitoxin n=1 Tax=Rheinheimera baltica TaxID=67576 RepID=UPI00273E2798|nr:HigA family addiction module antitoxin [Rheinheimera baltica]MDP5142575.1 HigA family addiction module antitoxin [Rheinheimera baltica]
MMIFLSEDSKDKKSWHVMPPTVQRLISGKSDISPEMAIRLAAVIGSSERVWMGMQDAYDLWHARQRIDTSKLQRLCSA